MASKSNPIPSASSVATARAFVRPPGGPPRVQHHHVVHVIMCNRLFGSRRKTNAKTESGRDTKPKKQSEKNTHLNAGAPRRYPVQVVMKLARKDRHRRELIDQRSGGPVSSSPLPSLLSLRPKVPPLLVTPPLLLGPVVVVVVAPAAAVVACALLSSSRLEHTAASSRTRIMVGTPVTRTVPVRSAIAHVGHSIPPSTQQQVSTFGTQRRKPRRERVDPRPRTPVHGTVARSMDIHRKWYIPYCAVYYMEMVHRWRAFQSMGCSFDSRKIRPTRDGRVRTFFWPLAAGDPHSYSSHLRDAGAPLLSALRQPTQQQQQQQ